MCDMSDRSGCRKFGRRNDFKTATDANIFRMLLESGRDWGEGGDHGDSRRIGNFDEQAASRSDKSGFRNVLGIGDTNGRLSRTQCDRWIVERSDKTRCRIRMCRSAGELRQRGRADQNSEWTPCEPSFWVGMALLAILGVPKRRMGSQHEPFLLSLCSLFVSSKKHASVKIRKPFQKTHPMDRPNMHVLLSVRFLEFVSCLRNSAHRKNAGFFEMGSSHFWTVFPPFAGRSEQQRMAQFHFWVSYSGPRGTVGKVGVVCVWCCLCLCIAQWSGR